MERNLFLILVVCSVIAAVSAWSPYYPIRVPRAPFHRMAPPRLPVHAHHRRPTLPVKFVTQPEDEEVDSEAPRPKRDHRDDYHDFDHDHDHDHDNKGSTGPVHTFVKTDKNANYKWGVRHHVGNKFAP